MSGLFNANMAVEEARAVVCPLKKHKGETLGQIADTDVLYLDWMNGIELRDARLKAAVQVLCEEYGRDIDEAVGEAD